MKCSCCCCCWESVICWQWWWIIISIQMSLLCWKPLQSKALSVECPSSTTVAVGACGYILIHLSSKWQCNKDLICKTFLKQKLKFIAYGLHVFDCHSTLIAASSVTDTRHLQAPAEDTSFRCFPHPTQPVLNLRCAVFL